VTASWEEKGRGLKTKGKKKKKRKKPRASLHQRGEGGKRDTSMKNWFPLGNAEEKKKKGHRRGEKEKSGPSFELIGPPKRNEREEGGELGPPALSRGGGKKPTPRKRREKSFPLRPCKEKKKGG